MEKPIIALITDFGAGSFHVGMMKGVMHTIMPEARIVDVTHDILPFNILHAGYVLGQAIDYFPSPTVFLAIVDPGVGTARRPIIAGGEKHYYVCPDNGLISRAALKDEISQVVQIEEEHYFLKTVCPTFHGRDIFAPCAAWLAKLLGIERFGEPIEDYVTLPAPKLKIVADRMVSVPVLFIDHFGNIVTSFERDFLEKARERFPGDSLKVQVNDQLIPSLSTHYYDVPGTGDPLAYFGSMDLLEIAVREGNAAARFGIGPGDSITILLGE